MEEDFKKVTILSDYPSILLAQEAHMLLAENALPGGLNKFDPKNLYINRFNAQEYQISVEENVRGRDVVVFVSPSCLNKKWEKSPDIRNFSYNPDSQFMKTMFLTDALRDSGASSIIFVMAHQTYQRQDRRSTNKKTGEPKREPISVRAYANLVRNNPNTKIISVTPHFKQISAVYPPGGFQEITTRVLFAEYLEKKFGDNLESIVGISPDGGAGEEVKGLCRDVGIVYFGHCGKDRSKPGEIAELRLYTHRPIREVEGKIAIIPDDMMDSGGTLITTTEKLRDLGVKDIYALMAHPILTKDALDQLESNNIQLITTNSIVHDFSKRKNVEVISLGYILQEALQAMLKGKTITGNLFNYAAYKKEKKAKRLW